MKLETTIVVTKGLCFFVVGGMAPLGVGLAQWANSGEWPPRIIWIVIICACVGSAFNNLLSFLSGSFSEYMKNRKEAEPTTVPDSPKPPTP